MRCHAALALVAVLGLWAKPALAASLAVVDEGERVFRYELVLEPGEVVAGIQLDLIHPGAMATILETGWSISIGLIGPFVFNPWTLTSSVAPVPGGMIRAAHTYDQSGDAAAGWSRTHEVQPGGMQRTYVEFLENQFGPSPIICDPGCFPDFEPTGIPVARLLVPESPASMQYTAGVCVPAAGAMCSFAETNVPEPVVLVLLVPLGMVLVIRQRAAG